MKFEYEEREDEQGCVAYIDAEGNLRIKLSRDDTAVWFADGSVKTGHGWYPDKTTQKFYPGDKLTITF